MAHPYYAVVLSVSSYIIDADEQVLGEGFDGRGLERDACRVAKGPHASFVRLEAAKEVGEQVLEPDDACLRVLPGLGRATSQAMDNDNAGEEPLISCMIIN